MPHRVRGETPGIPAQQADGQQRSKDQQSPRQGGPQPLLGCRHAGVETFFRPFHKLQCPEGYPTFPGELDARRRWKNVAISGGMEVKWAKRAGGLSGSGRKTFTKGPPGIVSPLEPRSRILRLLQGATAWSERTSPPLADSVMKCPLYTVRPPCSPPSTVYWRGICCCRDTSSSSLSGRKRLYAPPIPRNS